MKEEKEAKLCYGGKTIHLYRASQAAPLVIYHAVMGEGKKLWQDCQKSGCPEFSLAVINGVDWDDELTPWPIPPIAKGDTPCSGGADVYLDQLLTELLPEIREALPAPPVYCALSGYSLAGLFAVYAAYKTDCFSRIVSASGSLWYPDFLSFVQQNQISESVKAMYFSLGDKESHTKNPYLAPVEDNTRFLEQYYSEKGIWTTFRLNPGNHYHNSTGRTAAGIRWALQQ
ncbi:MAG: alpha/beta hydrolase [Lachnospiraceae bacterium]|nr:alpha/beta hydrolase [Lachnospiraceae bacterium]